MAALVRLPKLLSGLSSHLFTINRSQTMARAIWKGAISFGLVHIPLALVSTRLIYTSDTVDKLCMV
ncbi:hypothetical protein GIV31_22610 [Pseudomonas syringae]|nr:hypothetical protein [Pseudomonas syringae]